MAHYPRSHGEAYGRSAFQHIMIWVMLQRCNATVKAKVTFGKSI